MSKYSLSNLLYLWQILLKQAENLKYAAYPEYVFNAIVIILSHTASFPDIENLIIKEGRAPSENLTASTGKLAEKISNIIDGNVTPQKDKSNQLIEKVLNKFPGSIVSEIE